MKDAKHNGNSQIPNAFERPARSRLGTSNRRPTMFPNKLYELVLQDPENVSRYFHMLNPMQVNFIKAYHDERQRKIDQRDFQNFAQNMKVSPLWNQYLKY